MVNLAKPSDSPKEPERDPEKPETPSKPVLDDLPNIVSVAHQAVRSLEEADLPALTAGLSELETFKGENIKAPSHSKPEELRPTIKKRFDELVRMQSTLKESFSETTKRGDAVKSTATDLVSKAPDQLDTLLKSYNDAVSDRRRVDVAGQKLIDANIESYKKQAVALALNVEERAKELNKAIKEVTSLLERIKQHNNAVAVFDEVLKNTAAK